MPAKSQKQRAYLNSRFGHAWVKEHHFDNAGRLPMYAAKKKSKAKTKKQGAKKMGPWKGGKKVKGKC
jgi:hypothetical protein